MRFHDDGCTRRNLPTRIKPEASCCFLETVDILIQTRSIITQHRHYLGSMQRGLTRPRSKDHTVMDYALRFVFGKYNIAHCLCDV